MSYLFGNSTSATGDIQVLQSDSVMEAQLSYTLYDLFGSSGSCSGVGQLLVRRYKYFY